MGNPVLAICLHSLISAFIVRCLDSIIPTLAKCKVSRIQRINKMRSYIVSFCSWTGRVESYLVANPYDRFSCDVALMILETVLKEIIYGCFKNCKCLENISLVFHEFYACEGKQPPSRLQVLIMTPKGHVIRKSIHFLCIHLFIIFLYYIYIIIHGATLITHLFSRPVLLDRFFFITWERVTWEGMRGIEQQYRYNFIDLRRSSDGGYLRCDIAPHKFMLNTWFFFS